jgi:hypothetical protein
MDQGNVAVRYQSLVINITEATWGEIAYLARVAEFCASPKIRRNHIDAEGKRGYTLVQRQVTLHCRERNFRKHRNAVPVGLSSEKRGDLPQCSCSLLLARDYGYHRSVRLVTGFVSNFLTNKPCNFLT